MSFLTEVTAPDHERVVLCQDREAGYRSVIAIHSTVLGPAVGGTRLWRYPSDEQAIADALRLSRAMTYKCALAGVPLGGGKAVIIAGEQEFDREQLFRAHGRFVERLGGTYFTAEDVGTSSADMVFVRSETRYVAGLPGGGGDPSPWTARGVWRAMQAAAKGRWGTEELSGRHAVLQGCGHVGAALARLLRREGVTLTIADLDRKRAELLGGEVGATIVEAAEVYDVDADIFTPCALGGVIDDDSIERLRVEVIAGAANNQLAEDRHGDALHARGILYAPDYVANAGGVICGGVDLLGWPPSVVPARVDAIYDTTARVFEIAHQQGIAPSRAANQLAQLRLSGAA